MNTVIVVVKFNKRSTEISPYKVVPTITIICSVLFELFNYNGRM